MADHLSISEEVAVNDFDLIFVKVDGRRYSFRRAVDMKVSRSRVSL